MIGNLTEIQIDKLLQKEVVGRIGCYANDMVYVVPISYVYKDNNIYAHTNEGLKIELMRQNPNVCFEVDDLKDMGNWSSVIAWGKFQEISNEIERYAALKLLLNRPLPVISSITTHLGRNWPFYYDDLDMIDGIVFKIELTKITGKFETTTASPVFNF